MPRKVGVIRTIGVGVIRAVVLRVLRTQINYYLIKLPNNYLFIYFAIFYIFEFSVINV